MHTRKKIAPVIIGTIIVGYYLFIALIIGALPIGIRAKIITFIILASLSGAMIYVVIDRIKEIDGGEEDDLDNY